MSIKMKGFAWTLALLVATASGAVVDRRQLVGLFGGPLTYPNKIVNLPPQVRSDAKHQKIRFGPFTLSAVKELPNASGLGLLDLANKPWIRMDISSR
jgi:hypothetical protein